MAVSSSGDWAPGEGWGGVSDPYYTQSEDPPAPGDALTTDDYSASANYSDANLFQTMDTFTVNAPAVDPNLDMAYLDPYMQDPLLPMDQTFTPPDLPPPDVYIDNPQQPVSRSSGGSGGSGGSRSPNPTQRQQPQPTNPNNANAFGNFLNSLLGASKKPVTRQSFNPLADRNGVYTLSRGSNVPGGASSPLAKASKPGGAPMALNLKSMLPYLAVGIVILLVFKHGR